MDTTEDKGRGLHDNILLIQGIAVEEFGEIDDRVVRISTVIRICAVGLGVLLLHGVEVVRRPVGGFTESG